MPMLAWPGDSPSQHMGTTVAVPWEQRQCIDDRSSLIGFDPDGQHLPVQSSNTAYWPDGSIK